MKLYSENKDYKLYQGSMLDMLEVIEPQTIDSIITDPPYELNFMGKGWDNSGIAFQPDTWRKCYEVLKPGGYLLAFGGSRTFHRIACAIEDAGFEIRDTIMWLYGSGFPKSMDISKQIDKNNAKSRKVTNEFKNYLNKKRKEKGYSLADINRLMEVATTGGGFASSLMGEKETLILPTKENYNKLKKILDLDNRYDEMVEIYEAEREVIGKKESGCFNNQEKDRYTIGSSKSLEVDITIPSTDLAKQWQGWGTALKPSFEPIIVARKPFKGSLVDNVIENGVGGINIDECRVGNEERINKEHGYSNVMIGGCFEKGTNEKKEYKVNGRFPANTILTYNETDFDEVCGGFPNTSGGKMKLNSEVKRKGMSADGSSFNSNTCGFDVNKGTGLCNYGDSGSASRYFYCAKASKKDRDEGLDEFEEKKGIRSNAPRENEEIKTKPRKNTHPTVKPTELMQYLIRLVTPNNGTVLDPFNGSGSTGKAVMYENKEHNKNYKYIGIELTEEYLPIAKARIEYVCNLIEEEKIKDKQLTIFDIGDE